MRAWCIAGTSVLLGLFGCTRDPGRACSTSSDCDSNAFCHSTLKRCFEVSQDAGSAGDAAIDGGPGADAGVDPCRDNGGCDPNAACITMGSSRTCKCNSGYWGAGEKCTKIACDGNVGFPGVLSTSLSARPDAVVSGQVDADSRPDLVVASKAGNKVFLLPGKGDGTFGQERIIASTTSPASLALGDVTGDDILDLVIASTSGTITIMKGAGDGTFTELAPKYSVDSNPLGMALVKLNADSLNDILIVAGKSAYVLTNKGNGQFNSPVAHNLGGTPTAMAVDDFSHDLFPDLAVAVNNAVLVLKADGTGGLGTASSYDIGAPAFRLATGDYDNDNAVDIVALTPNEVIILRNGPDNTRGASGETFIVKDELGWLPAGALPVDATFRINGFYGYPELVLLDSLGNVTSCASGASRAPLFALRAGITASVTMLIDFDGDGNLDMMVADKNSDTVLVAMNGMPLRPGGNLGDPAVVAVGRMNGDARDDVVVGGRGSGKIAVRLNSGNGSFVTAATDTGGPVIALLLADLNHDTLTDVIALEEAVSTAGRVRVWTGNGDGTLKPVGRFLQGESGAGFGSLASGDFDGDGHIDIAVANATSVNGEDQSGTVEILFGKGDASFEPSTTVVPSGVLSGLAVAHFDEDGYADLAIGKGTSVSLRKGTADRTFSAPIAFPVPGEPMALAAADLNHDNLQDLIVVIRPTFPPNNQSGVAVLMNVGSGLFASASVLPAGTDPRSIAAGDLNGDGNIDIVVLGSDNGVVTVFTGNGDGTFRKAKSYLSGYSYYDSSIRIAHTSIALGDFNADSVLDFVIGRGISHLGHCLHE